MRRLAWFATAWTICVPALADTPATGVATYAAMGIEKGAVLSATQATAHVLSDEEKQVVCLVAYLSGKKDKSDAVNLKLAVLESEGDELRSVWEQDFGAKYGGNVGEGDLQLFDLDRDGKSELIVTFDVFSDPLIRQRYGEVILRENDAFVTGWSGPVEYDATKAVREIPAERRDRYVRELDYESTLRTRGVTLFFNKTMIAVAGERLAEPKVVEEAFPLRTRVHF